jgi:hypothetical protein
MEKTLKCIKCSQDRDVGRKMCRSCYLEHKRSLEKNRYKKHGRKNYQKTCAACKLGFEAWRKKQIFCLDCHKLKLKFAAESKSTNNYKNIGGKNEHRSIAESILGYKLSYNMVVHHVDDNPKNNEISNLMVMDRRTHGRLHQYLDYQRVIIEKSMNENCGNCWKTLIASMTTAWLETTSAKVLKLWEIGQSAAEPQLK